jgi:hypothetical protein
VQVNQRLRAALDDVERELAALEPTSISKVVKSAQLMQAMTAISAALSNFWMATGDIIRLGQEEARTEALKLAFDWDSVLLRLALPAAKRAAMRNVLLEASRFNVEAMLARVYKTRLPLSDQVYKTAALTNGWVESRIDRALARGATVRELSQDVRDFISPRTPGGATYAARRLARTEINAAYHAVIIAHNEDKPWVVGVQWSLSGSHPTVDICDRYARNDHSGLGKGVFPRRQVPPKPHPQCLCYVYPKVLPPEVFVDQLRNGLYEDYLSQTYE